MLLRFIESIRIHRMDPAYEHFRYLQPKAPTSLRVPETILTELGAIAEIEGGGTGALLIEGAMRVIEDRRKNLAFLERQISWHDETLAAIDILTNYAAHRNQAAI